MKNLAVTGKSKIDGGGAKDFKVSSIYTIFNYNQENNRKPNRVSFFFP